MPPPGSAVGGLDPPFERLFPLLLLLLLLLFALPLPSLLPELNPSPRALPTLPMPRATLANGLNTAPIGSKFEPSLGLCILTLE